MDAQTYIGIDLGGTNIRGARVTENRLSPILLQGINSKETAEKVLHQLFSLTDELMIDAVKAIGIGVPGLVDITTGTVYDVVNIPSWKKISLQKLMEERYKIPVVVNNDANCFALGEFYFGSGKGCHSMVGITIGTGLGSGIIINGKLYAGTNCGAGEFGMVDYLDHCYEYYASGEFFKNVHGVDGEVVFKNAGEGDADALKMYQEFGLHLGNAIRMILFTLDPELIVFGGSVRKAFPFFSKAMWQVLQTFPFQRTVDRLRIEVSALENSGILGAAALYNDLHTCRV